MSREIFYRKFIYYKKNRKYEEEYKKESPALQRETLVGFYLAIHDVVPPSRQMTFAEVIELN